MTNAPRRPHRCWENPALPIPHFDPGDIVKLKSGGPLMVVDRASQGSVITAAWFADNILQRASFEPTCLERPA